MTPRRSCLLVIDASVIHSAGEKTNLPQSSACRDALLAVLKICHRVALTTEMRDEWKRHMRRFSRKWRRSMAAHHKAPETVSHQSIQIDTDALPEADRQAIEKDRCLLEAALSADRVIVTRDEALRRALVKTRQGKQLADSIKWINPVKDGIGPFQDL